MVQGMTLYDPQQHSPLVYTTTQDPGVSCLCFAARVLWLLGYPDQALERIQTALTLAQELSHPFSLAYTFRFAAAVYQYRRETPAAQKWAEKTIVLATEQGFPLWLAHGTITRVGALAQQGQVEECIAQMRQDLTAVQTEVARPFGLALLAEAYGKVRQAAEGISVLVEALAFVDKTGVRYYGAELYRLKGELTLQQCEVQSSKFKGEEEAVTCFLKAIDIARKQQAKSLELRAVMSLVRLRRQQAPDHTTRNTQHETRIKLAEAHKLLSEVYNWFTEGFDTKDLQEAKALLDELS
jgi:predicted ATPase